MQLWHSFSRRARWRSMRSHALSLSPPLHSVFSHPMHRARRKKHTYQTHAKHRHGIDCTRSHTSPLFDRPRKGPSVHHPIVNHSTRGDPPPLLLLLHLLPGLSTSSLVQNPIKRKHPPKTRQQSVRAACCVFTRRRRPRARQSVCRACSAARCSRSSRARSTPRSARP